MWGVKGLWNGLDSLTEEFTASPRITIKGNIQLRGRTVVNILPEVKFCEDPVLPNLGEV